MGCVKSTKYYSDIQEQEVAKYLGGKQVFLSGGGKFDKGDVEVGNWLIEAKTSVGTKKSFSIPKAWLDKLDEQSFEMGKAHHALAFRYSPTGEDYFIVDKKTFKDLLEAYYDRENCLD